MRACNLRGRHRRVSRARASSNASKELATAQHEAAHLVVGVALGLKLHRATIKPIDDCLGYVAFFDGPREAELIMLAAGVAWERKYGNLRHAGADLKDLRRMRVRGNARIRVLERAAWAILESRPGMHARITRALLEDDVTPATLAAIVRAYDAGVFRRART